MSDQTPLPHDGIRLGEVEGWRCWWVTPKGLLRSMVVNQEWGACEALEAPYLGHDSWGGYLPSGIHAWKSLQEAWEYGVAAMGWDQVYSFTNPPTPRRIVVGRVALWGDIVEHTRGYRAQFAKPLSFDRMLGGFFRKRFLLWSLRRKYGV